MSQSLSITFIALACQRYHHKFALAAFPLRDALISFVPNEDDDGLSNVPCIESEGPLLHNNDTHDGDDAWFVAVNTPLTDDSCEEPLVSCIESDDSHLEIVSEPLLLLLPDNDNELVNGLFPNSKVPCTGSENLILHNNDGGEEPLMSCIELDNSHLEVVSESLPSLISDDANELVNELHNESPSSNVPYIGSENFILRNNDTHDDDDAWFVAVNTPLTDDGEEPLVSCIELDNSHLEIVSEPLPSPLPDDDNELVNELYDESPNPNAPCIGPESPILHGTGEYKLILSTFFLTHISATDQSEGSVQIKEPGNIHAWSDWFDDEVWAGISAGVSAKTLLTLLPKEKDNLQDLIQNNTDSDACEGPRASEPPASEPSSSSPALSERVKAAVAVANTLIDSRKLLRKAITSGNLSEKIEETIAVVTAPRKKLKGGRQRRKRREALAAEAKLRAEREEP